MKNCAGIVRGKAGSEGARTGVSNRYEWSGRRDLNPGPLAPQARNINHLQSIPTENKRVTPRRFGRHLDAKTPNRPFGLRLDSTDALWATTSCVAWKGYHKIAGIATVFVAQGLTLEGFKVVMEVAHPPRVEGVTMPSTMGGISLFCALQFELAPLLLKLAPLMGRLHAERSPRQVIDSVVA